MRIGVLAAAADILQGKQLLLHEYNVAAPALQLQLSLHTDVLTDALTDAHHVLKGQRSGLCAKQALEVSVHSRDS